jgi:hypothetical protein
LRRGQLPVPPINLAMPTANPPPTVADTPPASVGVAQVSNIDMQTLANEVAQVLIRSTSGNTLNTERRAQEDAGAFPRPQSMRVANPSADNRPTSDLSDPPAYRRQPGFNSPTAQKAALPRD